MSWEDKISEEINDYIMAHNLSKENITPEIIDLLKREIREVTGRIKSQIIWADIAYYGVKETLDMYISTALKERNIKEQ